MAVKFGGVRGDGLTFPGSPAISGASVVGFVSFPAPSSGRAAIANFFNGSGDQVVVHQNGSSQLESDAFNGGTLQLGSITANTWYFFALVCTGTTAVLYIAPATGGAITSTSGSLAASGFTPTSIQLFINQLYTSSDFNASGAGVRFFNVALNLTQVTAERTQFAPVLTANCYASYRLLDAATCTADNSGNSRTATKIGTATTVADPAGVPEGGSTTVKGWSTVYPHSVPRPSLHTSAHLAAVLPPPQITPPVAPTFFGASFPDALPNPANGNAHRTLGAAPILPPVAAPWGWSTVYPATVARALSVATAAAFLAPVPSSNPFPRASFPDSIAAASRVQPQSIAAPILPPAAPTPIAIVEFPDTTWRPVPQAGSVSFVPVFPAPAMVDGVFPDWLPRPTPQQSTAAFLTPFLTPTAFVEFPDAVARPSLAVWQQGASALGIVPPVATAPFVGTSFPDSVARLAPQQGASSGTIFVAPAVAPTFFGATFPDAIARAALATSQHQAFAFGQPPIAASVAPTFFGATYPASLPRAALPTAEHQAFAFGSPPIVAASIPFVAASYPAAVVRLVAQQGQQPELIFITPFVAPSFPDAVRRPANGQWPSAAEPILPPAPTYVGSVFPDALRRFAPMQSQGESVPPFVSVPFVGAMFPDSTWRPVPAQVSAATIGQLPIHPPMAFTVFPDVAPRASLATGQFQYFTAPKLPPPPPVVPIYFGATFPASLPQLRFVGAFTTSLPFIVAPPGALAAVCFVRSLDVDVDARRLLAADLDVPRSIDTDVTVTRTLAGDIVITRRLPEC